MTIENHFFIKGTEVVNLEFDSNLLGDFCFWKKKYVGKENLREIRSFNFTLRLEKVHLRYLINF